MSVNWWMNWYCNILTSTYESYWSPVSFKKSLCFATSMQHEAQGVFQMPRTPALWVASGEISQLSCRISQRDTPFLSATLGILRLYRVHRGDSTTKMSAPMKIFIMDWADIVTEPTEPTQVPIVIVLIILIIISGLQLHFWGPWHIPKLKKLSVHIGIGEKFGKI